MKRSEAEAAASAAVEASIKSIIIDNGEFVEIMCGWDWKRIRGELELGMDVDVDVDMDGYTVEVEVAVWRSRVSTVGRH